VQGRHHLRRREHLVGRGRAGVVLPPGGGRGGGGGQGRRPVGRDPGGVRGAPARRHGHGRRAGRPPAEPVGSLQGPEAGRLLRPAEDRHREDPQERAPGLGGRPRRALDAGRPLSRRTDRRPRRPGRWTGRPEPPDGSAAATLLPLGGRGGTTWPSLPRPPGRCCQRWFARSSRTGCRSRSDRRTVTPSSCPWTTTKPSRSSGPGTPAGWPAPYGNVVAWRATAPDLPHIIRSCFCNPRDDLHWRVTEWVCLSEGNARRDTGTCRRRGWRVVARRARWRRVGEGG